MIKILFLIHDLGQGGAEKVLVNLVNNMDQQTFDITVMSLFGGGVNEQFLEKHIHYKTVFNKTIPGNTTILKLLSPSILHSLFVKEQYDVEISYLEGPSARIISGCKNPTTKLISWIHVEQHSMKCLAQAFRSKREAISCYNRFDKTIAVSACVKKDFTQLINYQKDCQVLYNTVESDQILKLSLDAAPEIESNSFSIISVGTLKPVKGHDRIIKIIDKLRTEGINAHLYILGKGPYKDELKNLVENLKLDEKVTFLGYQTNPYKYVKKSNLFVCASFAEGFSTAATEALIVGTPVCTVEVSGMKEMLGNNNEHGVVVQNNDIDLFEGIKQLILNEELYQHYKSAAVERGKNFHTQETVQRVEEMLVNIINRD